MSSLRGPAGSFRRFAKRDGRREKKSAAHCFKHRRARMIAQCHSKAQILDLELARRHSPRCPGARKDASWGFGVTRLKDPRRVSEVAFRRRSSRQRPTDPPNPCAPRKADLLHDIVLLVQCNSAFPSDHFTPRPATSLRSGLMRLILHQHIIKFQNKLDSLQPVRKVENVYQDATPDLLASRAAEVSGLTGLLPQNLKMWIEAQQSLNLVPLACQSTSLPEPRPPYPPFFSRV